MKLIAAIVIFLLLLIQVVKGDVIRTMRSTTHNYTITQP